MLHILSDTCAVALIYDTWADLSWLTLDHVACIDVDEADSPGRIAEVKMVQNQEGKEH